MAEQMRPASKKNSPDPTTHFDRQHPEHESAAGKLTREAGDTPINRPDEMDAAVSNKRQPKELEQDPNAQEPAEIPAKRKQPDQPDHSMKQEEPLGWDQVPQDIHNPREKRHSRTGGKGGTA